MAAAYCDGVPVGDVEGDDVTDRDDAEDVVDRVKSTIRQTDGMLLCAPSIRTLDRWISAVE